jgi:hypothetical protein
MTILSRSCLRVFTLGAIMLPCSALAQKADIRGIVSDSLTGQRIPFADVTLVNTNWGASANNSGFYLIPSIPPGEYDIAATLVGYVRKVQHIIVLPGKASELNFQLASMPIAQKEVLVTAPRKRELSEISTSVHFFEQKDLKVSPVLAQEDVLQSLKILPGIVSTSDVSSKFYVRGGAGDQNLVLLDGMKIYNPFHALGIFSVFDPDIVQNVEMYTGAFPAGYGGRLSSVIDISTRDGRADRLSGRASLNFLSSKVQLEGPAYAGSSWMVNGRKSLFSETFKKLVNQDVPVSFYDLVFKFKHQFPQGAKFSLDILRSGDRLTFARPDEPNYSWQNSAISASVSGLIGDRVFVNFILYGSYYVAERDAKSSQVLFPSSTSIKEPGLRAVATYYTDARDLLFFGFEFTSPTLKYNLVNNLNTIIDLASSFIDFQIWIRYQVKYDRLQMDMGLHADIGALLAGEQGVEAFQPRVNASYLLFGNWRAKASLGTFSQKTVAVGNEDDVISIFDPWIKIPSDLPPETSVHVVLGIDGNLIETVSLSLQAYHKTYTSLVTYNRDKFDAKDPDYIGGSGKSYGAELLLRSKISLMDLYASYALSWTTIRNLGFEYYPRYDRRHHVNLLGVAHVHDQFDVTLRWEFGSGFPFTQSVGFYDRLRLTSAVPGPFELETGQPYLELGKKNAARLPIYHRLDISALYRFTLLGMRGSFGGQIINVYDSKNIFYFDRKTGQRSNMLRFFPSATLTIEY